MARKPTKPPTDKKSVRNRLEYAEEGQLLVRLRRWIPAADALDGFVVGVGERWVALQRLSDRVAFDGYQVVRLKDIQQVSIDPDPACFEIKVLRERHLWPPSRPALELDDTVGVVGTASKLSSMLSLFDEFARPDVCSIGSMVSADDSAVMLLEVNPRGEWFRTPTAFDPRSITRIDFGGGYEEALELVAGSPPSAQE